MESSPNNNNNNNTKILSSTDWNCNETDPCEGITKFYKGSTVFMTGVTGFVGKALLEKLLRTCVDVNAIYVLMREKRGMSVEQRMEQLIKNPVFNRVREKDPKVFDKIYPIAGDVSLPKLGLSDADYNKLSQFVDIVFHSAATVKFNEDLKNAVILNTLGTKRVLELCHEMSKLKSFVHVSTAYSNSDKEIIDEIVYQPQHKPENIINCIDVLPKEGVDMLAKRLQGKHPNTYTLTKSLAEYLVFENSSTIPSAIVRPSIITAAWRDPYPGWVDNVSGITGIFMECGRGTIKSIICDDRCKMDLIPVDIVVNTLITAAWHTATQRVERMRVYNCTSGETNPISWKEFGVLTHRYALCYPSKYVTWYPGFTYRTSKFLHCICAVLFHLIPSALLDIFLYLTGHKPIMLKISKKFYSALDAGKFFSTNDWVFRTETMTSLANDIARTEDSSDFPVDISKSTSDFDWDAYVHDFMLGVRLYVLKDDLSSLPAAKAKLKRLYWLQTTVRFVALYIFAKILTRIFS